MFVAMSEIFDIGNPDVGEVYRELRKRINELCTGLSAQDWERITPHCPDWTVRQTLAHLAGVVDDGINGNLAGVATEPWTALHVTKRADRSGEEILEEWNTWAPFVEDRATNIGLGFAQMVFDAVTHEHDLRFALGKPGARDSEALRIGLTLFQARLPGSAERTGVLCPQITGSLFDVVRSIGSRRTLDEIASLNWSGDPRALMSALLPFAPPSTALGE
jgi:uncharacterized protein (TIGR03083 family)